MNADERSLSAAAHRLNDPADTGGQVGGHVDTGARFYLPQLDGLRFFAAAAVLVHHGPRVTGLGWLKDNGWAGVDLFLCLSAYLVTTLVLLEQRRTGGFRLGAFMVRRALRIWPLYLGFASAMCALALLHTDARVVLAWWLSHLAFSANVMTAINGYSPVLFTSHLWTISLEEQAYLLLPLVLIAWMGAGASRAVAIRFALASLGLLLVARLALTLGGAHHPFIWVLPLRGDAFILGALAAILSDRVTVPASAGLVGLALLAAVALFPSPDGAAYQIIGYPITAAGAALLTVALLRENGWSRAAGMWPLRSLGKISYGIYVYHLLALYVVVRWLAFAPAWLQLASGFALTIAIATLSYLLFERPFLKLKRRFTIVESRPV